MQTFAQWWDEHESELDDGDDLGFIGGFTMEDLATAYLAGQSAMAKAAGDAISESA